MCCSPGQINHAGRILRVTVMVHGYEWELCGVPQNGTWLIIYEQGRSNYLFCCFHNHVRFERKNYRHDCREKGFFRLLSCRRPVSYWGPNHPSSCYMAGIALQRMFSILWQSWYSAPCRQTKQATSWESKPRGYNQSPQTVYHATWLWRSLSSRKCLSWWGHTLGSADRNPKAEC